MGLPSRLRLSAPSMSSSSESQRPTMGRRAHRGSSVSHGWGAGLVAPCFATPRRVDGPCIVLRCARTSCSECGSVKCLLQWLSLLLFLLAAALPLSGKFCWCGALFAPWDACLFRLCRVTRRCVLGGVRAFCNDYG